jgi:hypothetical protein
LATGRKRSELHTLSVSESCIRFAADKSSVTLLTDPAFFLAKNQLSEKGSVIVIPALPNSGPTNLCPLVKAQRSFLSRIRLSRELHGLKVKETAPPIKKTEVRNSRGFSFV